MSLVFRNVDVGPEADVESWPFEALVTAIERGGVREWARIGSSIARDPWGPIARQVEEYLSYARPYGVAGLLERRVARAREDAARGERAEVAAEVARLVDESGLTLAELAERTGTSRPRLSTYRSGSVTPSAAYLVRLRRAVDAAAAGPRSQRR